MVASQGAASWRKFSLPCQPFIASSFLARGEASRALPHPRWDFDWFDLVQILYMQSQLMWVHVCNCEVMCNKYCFPVDVHFFWILGPLCNSSKMPEARIWSLDPAERHHQSSCTNGFGSRLPALTLSWTSSELVHQTAWECPWDFILRGFSK